MGKETWLAVWRAFPGPVGVAAWIAVTVPVPLVFFEATHRWEDDQDVSTALWWTMWALPLLAAVVTARWTARTGRRRAARAVLAAVAVGTLVSAVFLAGSVAFYRWVIPLGGSMSWSNVLWRGLPLAVIGDHQNVGAYRRRPPRRMRHARMLAWRATRRS